MELHEHVPVYTVRLAEHLTVGVTQWTRMQRDGFIKEASRLGDSTLTRAIRHTGGRETWTVVGDYHMTYTADPHSKTISVIAAQPCNHHTACTQNTTP